jgi:multidrug resistance efflux pump
MMAWVRTRALPWVVWAGTMVAAGVLWFDVRHESAVGFALGTEYLVAPHVAGRIETLQVSPGQRVRAGQIVATLDAEAIDAELAILAAERERLSAELGAVRSDSQVRNFDTSASSTSRSPPPSSPSGPPAPTATSAPPSTRPSSSQTEVLKTSSTSAWPTAASSTPCSSAHRASRGAADRRRPDPQLASQAAAAKTRRQLLPTDAATQAVRPLQAELAVIAGQEQLLAARRAEIVLRAPADGEVAAIHLRPGEVAVAGAPIVTIVAATASEVSSACASRRPATSPSASASS